MKDERDEPDEEPAYNEDGVDLTLIRWMLSMTPEERIRAVQRHARAIRKLPDARTRA